MVDLKYEECIARIRSDKESNPKIIDLRIHAMQARHGYPKHSAAY